MLSAPVASTVQEEIDLADVWQVIWNERRVVVIATLIPLLVAVALAMTQPKRYVTEATILPMAQRSEATELLAAGMAAQVGPVASTLGGLAPFNAPDLTALLYSRQLAEQVAAKYPSLSALSPQANPDDLALRISEMIKVVPSTRGKALSIQVSAADSELAVIIANAYVDELKITLDRLVHEQALKKQALIDRYLAEAKADLQASRAQLTPEEVEARTIALKVLAQQQEAARLEALQESRQFLPLDKAKVSESVSPAQARLLIPIGLLVGLTLGIFAAFRSHRIRMAKR